MKILFSPTKDFNLNNPQKVNDKNFDISNITNQIMNKLISMNDLNLHELFKLSEEKFIEVKNYIKSWNSDTVYKALDMYNGLSFKTLKSTEFNDKELSFLDEHLLILSALYGPINPEKYIKPYRLDFTNKLKIDNISLRNLWKDLYNNSINENELVFNLASEEFSSLFDKNRYNWIDFSFYYKKNGELKTHSTNSKKGRGWLVSYITKNEILEISQLKNINSIYYYDENLSSDKEFVFIKK